VTLVRRKVTLVRRRVTFFWARGDVGPAQGDTQSHRDDYSIDVLHRLESMRVTLGVTAVWIMDLGTRRTIGS
jgi:hypothetical protein